MMLAYALLFLHLIVSTERTWATRIPESVLAQRRDSKGTVDWMTAGFLDVVDTLVPLSRPCDNVEARKRKKHKLNKYVVPLIVGFLLIKSILLPIALKALAVLSGKAVVLSLMSLILAAIVGLKKIAQSPIDKNFEVVNIPSKYRRQDVLDVGDQPGDNEPYRFYKERRRKK